MAILPALIALSAVAQTPSTLTVLAAACNDPSNLPQTKTNLLESGWKIASSEIQAKVNKDFSDSLHPDDTLAIAASVFERPDVPSLQLIVAEEREADGFWMRSCVLRDPDRIALTDLTNVKTTFSLRNDEDVEGTKYSWESWDSKITYYLYLDPNLNGSSFIMIQKYGRDQ